MARHREYASSRSTAGHRLKVLLGNTIIDQQEGPYQALFSECDDVVRQRKRDNEFFVEHSRLSPEPLNGENIQSVNTYSRYTDYVAPSQRLFPTHLSVPGVPSIAVAATTALARTNPGRAVVSAPVFIGELRDLPHALRSAGDFVRDLRKVGAKNSSGQYLAWQFGWKPLFDDLRKVIQFQDSVDKRAKELARLYDRGGLKRRIELGQYSAHSESNSTIESTLGSLITTRMSTDTTVRRWATVRWRPTKVPTVITDLVLRKLARKAVFGLSIQAEDAWNLMPWTWLSDWFLNIGDFLEAYNNRIPAQASLVNVMTETKTLRTWRRTDSHIWARGGNSSSERVTRRRDLSFGGIGADFQFLTGRQLSILGALAITRTRDIRL